MTQAHKVPERYVCVSTRGSIRRGLGVLQVPGWETRYQPIDRQPLRYWREL